MIEQDEELTAAQRRDREESRRAAERLGRYGQDVAAALEMHEAERPLLHEMQRAAMQDSRREAARQQRELEEEHAREQHEMEKAARSNARKALYGRLRRRGVTDLMEAYRQKRRSPEFKRQMRVLVSKGQQLSPNKGSGMHPIRRLDTGQVYPSLAAAAGDTNRHRTALQRAVEFGWTCAGTKWEWAKDSPQWGLKRDAKPLLAIEANRAFKSQYDAAKVMGVGIPTLRAAVRKSRLCCNQHWRELTLEEYGAWRRAHPEVE